eukprot:SAG31_NODE_2745_length_5147_cov_20.624604_4_plen_191_part_00
MRDFYREMQRTNRESITIYRQSTIVAIALVGATVGAVLAGPLLDRAGRKKTILLSSALFAVSGLGLALAQSFTQLVLMRSVFFICFFFFFKDIYIVLLTLLNIWQDHSGPRHRCHVGSGPGVWSVAFDLPCVCAWLLLNSLALLTELLYGLRVVAEMVSVERRGRTGTVFQLMVVVGRWSTVCCHTKYRI